MRVWELQKFGFDGLVLVERPEPEPGPGEVLVRLRAVALNSRDLQVIHNQYAPAQRLPIIPVSDGAGEVLAVGDGVTRVKRGDRVTPILAQTWLRGDSLLAHFGSMLGGELDGVLGECGVFSAEGLVPVPEHLTWEQAATLHAAGTTAWQALFTLGNLQPGQTVLVQGTGGVSLFALQFAVMGGARVIVTSSSDEKLARAQLLGASEMINYRTHPEWQERVRELTSGEGVDHVIEVAGDVRRSVNALRPGGVISQIGYLADLRIGDPQPIRISIDMIPFLLKNARIHGIAAGPRDTCEAMYRAVAIHSLEPVVDRVFDFDHAVDALRYLQSGTHFGKVCIRI